MTALLAGISILLAIALVVAILRIVDLRRASAPPTRAGDVDDRTAPPDERPGVLDLMDTGVVILNETSTPISANAAARRMLQLPGSSLPGRLRSDELLSTARRAITEGRAVDAEITLWPNRTEVRVRAVPLDEDDRTVLFLQDMTEEMRTHQIRRQFVVNASHELKTPVAGLQALAEAIVQAIDDDSEKARGFATRLLGESERLGRLTQDLLDLSRLEDPAHFSNELVDLAALGQRETREMTRAAEGASIQLAAQADEGVTVRGDEQQLSLMFRNLIDNAIRHTPAGGRVEVRVHRDGTDAVLEVEDTGEGIPLNAQGRVFERFFRVDDDRARNSGGTGLGLSIVKHVAELHGGHVSVASELGEGSTFRARLPLSSDTSR